ncbi:DUF852 domain-containing protein [Rhodotorula toruloides ATCC 204091]|uniref:ESCRT-II complex subunit VPS25 n=1 Tax=Rhodotorula toruloides TaxID=5286 RepID=A0A2T0A495_RHOTO|nr:DUF852 domain-containing protein [Rhodotorula toruloides ATCC 204091]KAK4332527.1 Vacuolar protein-sorting-associated protein 25 [Rhodotorula toruloides]PRQ72844.1 DUF852 domain-containing protein [Rhodotorula toruloides]
MQTATQPTVAQPATPAPPSSLTLRPTASATSSFLFPSIWSFQPFFTQQPNPQTYAHQLALWTQLVLTWCRFTRTWRIDLSHETCEKEPFRNAAIKRQVPLPFLRLIIESLVSAGSAEYNPKPTKNKPATGAWIYWKRPEEWAQVIYDWVKETGQTNSIMTFYELTEGGDLVHTTEFYRLPIPILRKALDILIKQGKAQVLKGTGAEEGGEGVKFV